MARTYTFPVRDWTDDIPFRLTEDYVQIQPSSPDQAYLEGTSHDVWTGSLSPADEWHDGIIYNIPGKPYTAMGEHTHMSTWTDRPDQCRNCGPPCEARSLINAHWEALNVSLVEGRVVFFMDESLMHYKIDNRDDKNNCTYGKARDLVGRIPLLELPISRQVPLPVEEQPTTTTYAGPLSQHCAGSGDKGCTSRLRVTIDWYYSE